MQIKLKDPVTPSKKANKVPTLTYESQWEVIYSRKNTASDLEKISEVRTAIANGEIAIAVQPNKLSKAYVMKLYETLKELRKDSYIKTVTANMPDNYHLVDINHHLIELSILLDDETEIALDTETTGVGIDDRICGVSLSLPKSNTHFYIPCRHTNAQYQIEPTELFGFLKPYLEDSSLGKVLHNAKFDSHMLYKEGIDLKGITMDTMIAFHVLNENEPSYALKALATKYGKHFDFEDKSWKYEDLFGKNGFENTPLDIGTYYACKDTHLTLRLANWIREVTADSEQLQNALQLENRLLPVVIQIERNGMFLDLDFAHKYLNELKDSIDFKFAELLDITGLENPNSNSQLLKHINSVYNLNLKSVDKENLKKVAKEVPLAQKVLDYRAETKLYTTYIEPLPKLVWADGRLRGSFNQRGTVTGRFSSNRPNLQNIPEIAREMIVAPDGKMLVGIDLSQQEVRYMAHLSGDKALQQPYLEGKDIYSTLASEVFNKPLEECSDGSKYRKMMKVGVLAVLYGISPFQLKDTLGITEEEAEKFLNDFKDKYPTMKQFMEETENEAFSNDFVWIEGGYKRRFPDGSKLKRAYETIQKKTGLKDLGKLWGSKLQYSDKRKYWDNVVKPYTSIQRQSTNSKIQGGSAVMTKLALIQLQEYFDTELTEDYKIIACVHDEVIFEIPENASEEVITKLAEIMAKALPMVIPMCCDIQYMKRWGVSIKESRRYDPNIDS